MCVWSLQKHVLLCSHAAVITKILQYPFNINLDSLIPLVPTHIKLYSWRHTESLQDCNFLCRFISISPENFSNEPSNRDRALLSVTFGALVWFVHTKISFERDWHSILFYKRRGLKTEFWEWLWLMCAVWMELQSITSYLSCHQHA